jgi:disulfide bond formation protein DsbB
MTDTLSLVFAAGAVVIQALLAVLLLLAVVSLFSTRARATLVEVRDTLLGMELWGAWSLAAIATAGSLYYSEVADFVPCRLCWFQRIAMYPLVAILLIAAIRRDVRGGVLYALPFPIVGAAISAYHIYIEYHPEAESQSCKAGVPCSFKWIEELGYVTLPVLAISAFGGIIALLLFALSRRNQDGSSAGSPSAQASASGHGP